MTYRTDFIIPKSKKLKTCKTTSQFQFFKINVKMIMPNNLSSKVIYDGARVLPYSKIFQREN